MIAKARLISVIHSGAPETVIGLLCALALSQSHHPALKYAGHVPEKCACPMRTPCGDCLPSPHIPTQPSDKYSQLSKRRMIAKARLISVIHSRAPETVIGLLCALALSQSPHPALKYARHVPEKCASPMRTPCGDCLPSPHIPTQPSDKYSQRSSPNDA